MNKTIENYINALKNGKQIRIKYNEKQYDQCENQGWWQEELFYYDNKLDIFKCFYPVSTYKKDFCTIHLEREMEIFIKFAIIDNDNKYGEQKVTDIIIEDCNVHNNNSTVKEIMIEKIKNMTDDEVKELLIQIQ